MLTNNRRQVSRALTGCCVVLWLTGSLSIDQGNLTTQWTGTHCPQGQTQNSQHSHNHCTWHCGGIDTQGGGRQGELSTVIHLSRVWSLGVIPLQDAVSDGEFPPRGPPQIILQIA